MFDTCRTHGSSQQQRRRGGGGLLWCASWFLYWLTLLSSPTNVVNIILPSFSWDPRNECFSNSAGGVHMSVDQESQLYILCPSVAITERIQTVMTEQQQMYENMYLCTKEEFDKCALDPHRGDGRTRHVMKCDNPLDTQKLKYQSFSFQQFQSGEHGYAFEVGKTYYFIATSNGTKEGLERRRGGRCKHNNMKLAITICPQGNQCHLKNKGCAKKPTEEKKDTNKPSEVKQPPTPTTQADTPTTTPTPLTAAPCKPIIGGGVPIGGGVEPQVVIGKQVSESTQQRDASSAGSMTVVCVAVGSFVGGILLSILSIIVYRKTCGVKKLCGSDSRNLKNRESSMTEHTHVEVADDLADDQNLSNTLTKQQQQQQPLVYNTIQRAEMRKEKEALEALNQKFFNSTIDYRNSNEFKQEFRRLISSTNSTTGSIRYSDSERYCVTPVGGYCA